MILKPLIHKDKASLILFTQVPDQQIVNSKYILFSAKVHHIMG